MITDSDGTRLLVQLGGNTNEDPEFEMIMSVQAGGRLVVMVLKKNDNYICELQLFRYTGEEPMGQVTHNLRTLIDVYYGDRGNILPGRFPQPEMVELCQGLWSWFRDPYACNVSTTPFRYHLDVNRIPGVGGAKPVGVASIVYNRTEPPALMGSENEQQLKDNIALAKRVINEFWELNNNDDDDEYFRYRPKTNRIKVG